MDAHSTSAGSDDLSPFARKLAYWHRLDDADRAAILALPFEIRTVQPHHYIVRERDVAQYSSVLLSGFAVRHKTVGTGARQIVAIQMKGDAVDLQNSLLGVADHSVQMLTAGEVALIPREAVVDLAFRHPAVGKAMWIDTLVDASIYREWIANVGRRDGRTRVAHVLCEFALRLKVAGLSELTGYELPMSQEQLGDVTGLTAVHINRIIKGLEGEGLIERARPRAIVIGDWKKLAHAGDFDSAYLHLREDEPALA